MIHRYARLRTFRLCMACGKLMWPGQCALLTECGPRTENAYHRGRGCSVERPQHHMEQERTWAREQHNEGIEMEATEFWAIEQTKPDEYRCMICGSLANSVKLLEDSGCGRSCSAAWHVLQEVRRENATLTTRVEELGRELALRVDHGKTLRDLRMEHNKLREFSDAVKRQREEMEDLNEDLSDKVESLQRENEELKEDKARLDWLWSHTHGSSREGEDWIASWVFPEVAGFEHIEGLPDDIRKAIDAARAASAGEDEKSL